MPGRDAIVSLPAPSGAFSYWVGLLLGRLAPGLVFSVFVVDKLLLTARTWPAADSGVLPLIQFLTQALGLAYFVLLVVLYAVRLPQSASDHRPAIWLASLFGTFAILAVGVLPESAPHPALLGLSDLALLVAMSYTVWALSSLRRSFSILPEARKLVRQGPYGLSRNPLYLGEALAAVGLVLPNAGARQVVLIAALLFSQWIRIRAEERILEHAFPVQYSSYRDRVPRYLPRPWKLFARV